MKSIIRLREFPVLETPSVYRRAEARGQEERDTTGRKVPLLPLTRGGREGTRHHAALAGAVSMPQTWRDFPQSRGID